jgi:hypothetical protein
LEEEVVENLFVLEEEGVQFMGESNDHMEVMDREDPFLAGFEPFGLV